MSSFDYTVAVVKDSFLNDTTWSLATSHENTTGPWDWAWTGDDNINPQDWNTTSLIVGMQEAAVNSTLPYLYANISTCFDTYNSYFDPQGNVLVFIKNESLQTPPTDSLLLYVNVLPRYDDWPKNLWALREAELTSSGELARDVKPGSVMEWSVGVAYYEVDHCLMQQPPFTKQHCQLQYSPVIMWIVCAFNFIKGMLVARVWVSSHMRKRRDRNNAHTLPPSPSRDEEDEHKQTPLYTLGDAIASFMRFDDIHTAADRMYLLPMDLAPAKKTSWWNWARASKSPIVGKRTPRDTCEERLKTALVSIANISTKRKSQTNRDRNRQWRPQARQWRHAVSRQTWLSFFAV